MSIHTRDRIYFVTCSKSYNSTVQDLADWDHAIQMQLQLLKDGGGPTTSGHNSITSSNPEASDGVNNVKTSPRPVKAAPDGRNPNTKYVRDHLVVLCAILDLFSFFFSSVFMIIFCTEKLIFSRTLPTKVLHGGTPTLQKSHTGGGAPKEPKHKDKGKKVRIERNRIEFIKK